MFRSVVSLASLAVSLAQAAQPNILFVFTDDQDIELGSLQYLDAVTSRIQGQGKTFMSKGLADTVLVQICVDSR